ncbi:MAG: hypothetical protein AVDCRST_MAG01-01-5169, partial [uncultured Rubrobacteraceae bacterium]
MSLERRSRKLEGADEGAVAAHRVAEDAGAAGAGR